MRNLLLIGGMGSGKTTLANAIKKEIPEINLVSMSKYTVRIPLTLLSSTHSDFLSQSKQEYIESIFENEDVEWGDFSRQELDAFAENVVSVYGDTIFAEIGYRATKGHEQSILDNIPQVANVQYLKDKEFYVVGLKCAFENQVIRRILDKKGIDFDKRSLLEEQIRSTNEFFTIREILPLAHKLYYTDGMKSDDPEVVKQVIQAIQ